MVQMSMRLTGQLVMHSTKWCHRVDIRMQIEVTDAETVSFLALTVHVYDSAIHGVSIRQLCWNLDCSQSLLT